MKDSMVTATWRLLAEAAAIGWGAPYVMQQRVARLAGKRSWSAAQQAEALRMVTEKVSAVQQAQWIGWQAAVAQQQRAWWQAWAAAATGRPAAWTAPSVAQTTQLAARMLAPTRRKVQANARRLRSRR